MSTFKKAKVVMLPTNQQTKYLMVYSDVEKTKGKLILNGLKNDEYKEYQHLYIISDDEIKEDDYYILFTDKALTVLRCTGDGDYFNCKKIIATTDESLHIPFVTPGNEELEIYEYSILPKPSDSFISKYIEEYNKGNVITDVLVEYEDIIYNPEKEREYQSNDRINLEDCDKQFRLKINPKDNTITIKKVKDSWNREEVIELCKQAFIDGTYAGGFGPNEKTIDSETEKWIKENL